MMDGRITRLVCTATVVAGAGDEARSSASTESLLRTGLPAALPEALEHALGDDPTVYIARSLHCEASAGPAVTAAVLARAIAAQLARAVRDSDRDSTELVRFPSTADYLAAFLAALTRGDAWLRWYFRPLHRLTQMEPPAAFRALAAEGHDMAAILLALHHSGELGQVASAVGEEALAQSWPSFRPARPRHAEWLSLIRMALALAHVLGWDAARDDDLQTVAAWLADDPDADLDWADTVALAQALARAVWLVARPVTAASEVSADQLPAWVDWADTDALVAALSTRLRPALPPGARAEPRAMTGRPPRTLAIETALAELISSGAVILDPRYPVAGSVALWAALTDRMPELAEVARARDDVGLDWADPVALAQALARAVRLAVGPQSAASEVSADQLPAWVDWADIDALVAALSARLRLALPPDAPAEQQAGPGRPRAPAEPSGVAGRPLRALAIETLLAELISSGAVGLDPRYPVTGSVALWTALTDWMPELAEAPSVRDIVRRFVNHQLARVSHAARTGATPGGAEFPADVAQPSAGTDIPCAGVYLLMRTLDSMRMPGLCRKTGVSPALLLHRLVLRWAGPDAGSGDVMEALVPLVGDLAPFRGSFTADALQRLQAEVMHVVATQRTGGNDVVRLRVVPFGAIAMAVILGDADDLIWPGGRIQRSADAAGALLDRWQEATGRPSTRVERMPGDADDPGRAVLLAALAAMAHAHDGDPEIDLSLDLIALSVVRHWARWLRGFAAASIPYLLTTFVRRRGHLTAIGDGRLQVSLNPMPHDVVLDASGSLADFALQWPWLPEQTGADAIAAHAAGSAAGRVRLIEFTVGS